jgi:hypothetical protein
MEDKSEKAIENFLRKDDINIADNLSLVFRHWRWILFALFFSLMAAFAFIRFQVPKYQVSATVMLKDNNKGTGSAESEVFKELGLMQSASSMEDEIEVFKSRSIMYRVVKKLDLDFSYFSQGNPIYHEKYNNFPLRIETYPRDSVAFDDYSNSFEIEVIDQDNFILLDKNDEIREGKFSFQNDIEFPWGKLKISKTNFFNQQCVKRKFRIKKQTVQNVVSSYIGNLELEPSAKASSILKLYLVDTHLQKAKDVLSQLIYQRSIDAIEDKNMMSQNTADFINSRIEFILDELSTVEAAEESFKKTEICVTCAKIKNVC